MTVGSEVLRHAVEKGLNNRISSSRCGSCPNGRRIEIKNHDHALLPACRTSTNSGVAGQRVRRESLESSLRFLFAPAQDGPGESESGNKTEDGPNVLHAAIIARRGSPRRGAV